MWHLRSDWDGIQDTRKDTDFPHSSIHEDEPVFLLRAKDPASSQAVAYWAGLVDAGGGDPELVYRVRGWANRMTAWRQENYPEPKVADVPDGALKDV